MGIPVMILGESGTGKSASLRNYANDEVTVINVAGKPLPFKNKIPSETTDDYRKIKGHLAALVKQGCKSIVIDDSQYLMANEFMRRATERGFDKFTEIAQNMWELVNTVKTLPNDVIVFFLTHLERDANGNEKVKTIGKLLDEKITLEGMFTIVLKTNVTDGQYSFLTQNSGHDTVKSPIGLFPSYAIDNDLKYVDEKIRNYYELGEFLSDEEMAEIDEAAKKVDFEPEETGKKKKGRRSAKKEEPTETPTQEEKEEKPKSRRKRATEDLEKERAAVDQENADAIANAGLEEAGDDEAVDFKDVKEPELKEPPRRKKRGTTDEQKQETGEEAESAETEEEKEEPTEENAGESCSRRRRSVQSEEEQVEETPKRRRRRS